MKEEKKEKDTILNLSQNCVCLNIIFDKYNITQLRLKKEVDYLISNKIEEGKNCINGVNPDKESRRRLVIKYFIPSGKLKVNLMENLLRSHEIRGSLTLERNEMLISTTVEKNLNKFIELLQKDLMGYIGENFEKQETVQTLSALIEILEENHKNFYRKKIKRNQSSINYDLINPLIEIIKEKGIGIYKCGLKKKKQKTLLIPYLIDDTIGDGLL